MKRYFFKVTFLIGSLLLQTGVPKCFGQSYGLAFNSHEVITDQRTTLDLFPQGAYHATGSFQLSFDMAFLPHKADYFGYLFRVIENEKRNFDLVYNYRDVIGAPAGRSRFKLVIGERYSNIDFSVTPSQLFYQWNKIILDFNYEKHELVLTVNGKPFHQTDVTFSEKNNYRVLFGISNESSFKASDCSAFKIRNVQLHEGQKIAYSWPLDEYAGTTAHELVSGASAQVKNPVWLRAEHSIWRHAGTLHVKGISTAAYNPADEKIYIVGRDSLWTMSQGRFGEKGSAYSGGSFNLLPSNETIFNPFNRHLYNYYIDDKNKKISDFDFNTRQWQPNPTFAPIADYQQTNSFFCQSDSSLYIVGGYGRMTYKNKVHRYSLKEARWEEIQTKGDYYCPRYLAACATTHDGSSAYLLGGFGSHTGDQMLNAQNLYDLVKYDVSTKTFKKIYELKVPGEGFVFANSMVIDEKTKSFSALIFSNQKFNSTLQLMTGSLEKPTYRLVGSTIPFQFHDTHSFAKLFYAKDSRQLLAVTMYRPPESDQDSYYQFYSLLTPAENIISNNSLPQTTKRPYLEVGSFILISGGLVFTFLYFRKRKKPRTAVARAYEEDAKPATINEKTAARPHVDQSGPAVYLFGNLAIHDKAGKDLTGHFKSLVRELFLVIIIFSLKSTRGITPDKLIEMLWSDKSDKSARNNRSANLSKLKVLLNQISHIRLTRDTGTWRTDIDFDVVYVDYWEYIQIMNRSKVLNRSDIGKLMSITQRGAFVASAEYPWLDQIKTDVANATIDIYLEWLNHSQADGDSEFAIELANAIFVFDPVNEDAMMAKCRALSILGKHSLARSAFESFSKEFKELYGEGFKSDFTSIVSSF